MREFDAQATEAWRRWLWFAPAILMAILLAAAWMSGTSTWADCGLAQSWNPLSVLGMLTVGALGLPLVSRYGLISRAFRAWRLLRGEDRLGSSNPGIRRRGVAVLENLARNHPEESHESVMLILCKFIQFPPVREIMTFDDEGYETMGLNSSWLGPCPPDVEAAARAVGGCRANLPGKIRFAIESGRTFNLTDSNLVGADLRNANFSGMNLHRVKFMQADLTGADLAKANLQYSVFHDANLAIAKFLRANLSNARLERANLNGVDLTRANLEGTEFSSANLEGARLDLVSMKGARFAGANLAGADFSTANTQGANFACALLADAIGLTQKSLDQLDPSAPPESLPEGLHWPFVQGEDGKWSRMAKHSEDE